MTYRIACEYERPSQSFRLLTGVGLDEPGMTPQLYRRGCLIDTGAQHTAIDESLLTNSPSATYRGIANVSGFTGDTRPYKIYRVSLVIGWLEQTFTFTGIEVLVGSLGNGLKAILGADLLRFGVDVHVHFAEATPFLELTPPNATVSPKDYTVHF